MASRVPQFTIKLCNHRPSNEELLSDMKRVARAGKGALTFARYDQHGNYATNTVSHRFGSWSAALKAAGFRLNIDRGVSDEALFTNLVAVWRQLKRQPTGRDLVKAGGVSRYSACAYEARFGSWNKALLAFDAFMNRGEKPAAPARKRGLPRVPVRAQRRVGWRLRASVLIRDNCTCRMCGASPAREPGVRLHVDHIKPWAKGGATALHNLQTLCSACNIGKSDRLCILPRSKISRRSSGARRRSRPRRRR